ncbi:hypothetical protein JCM10213v2_000933 [Rhodosporidiobolus nylandii]
MPTLRSRSQSHRYTDITQLKMTAEFRRAVSEEPGVLQEEAVEFEGEEDDRSMPCGVEGQQEAEKAAGDSLTTPEQERAKTTARLEGYPIHSIPPARPPLRGYFSEADIRRASAPPAPAPQPTLAQRRGVGVVSIVKAERRKLQFETGKPV